MPWVKTIPEHPLRADGLKMNELTVKSDLQMELVHEWS